MIRLTKMADYGIVVLSHFARTGTELHSARALSEVTHLPLPTVSKLLKQLVQKSLLESHRGSSGGYRLARAATQISVADIVEALDGPVALTDCESGDCDISRSCSVKGHWNKLNHTVHQALAGLSLRELAGPVHNPLVPLGKLQLQRGGSSSSGAGKS